LAGGRFDEGERVDCRDGAVEGAADVRGDELEANETEQVAQHLSRASRAVLEDLIQVLQPILDPFDRWRLEDLLSAPSMLSAKPLCLIERVPWFCSSETCDLATAWTGVATIASTATGPDGLLPAMVASIRAQGAVRLPDEARELRRGRG
jgi:hypothetical protein